MYSYDKRCVIQFDYVLLWTLLAAIFNKESDIGTYTIRSVDDPRALNKVLYLKPPGNIYSLNELVALWEKKIGKTVEKIYIPEEKFLEDIKGQWENLSKIPRMLCYCYVLLCFLTLEFLTLGKSKTLVN